MPKTENFTEDKRIINQKLKQHEVSPQEYQKFLKTLPDDSEMAAEMVVYQEESEKK